MMIFGLSQTEVQAQKTFSVAGSDISSIYGSISYTIGQLDYISSGTSISVSQGIQQTFGKLVETINSNIIITVWPNPVLEILNIQITDDTGTSFDYQFYSMNGKLLESRMTMANFSSINLAKYSPATYILLVNHLNQKAITFKIIKY